MLPIASKLYALPPHESCFISSHISLETCHLTVVSFKDGHAQDNDKDRIRNYFLLLKNLGYIHGYSVCLWLRIIPKPMSIFNTNLKLRRWSLHAPSNPELNVQEGQEMSQNDAVQHTCGPPYCSETFVRYNRCSRGWLITSIVLG